MEVNAKLTNSVNATATTTLKADEIKQADSDRPTIYGAQQYGLP